MIRVSGLHLLLTYQCTFACDHCFVWGSPFQTGTMTLDTIGAVLDQAEELGTVESIYFEGGEPFLFYPVLVDGVRAAARRGFGVGIVTNAYWATEERDAVEWLKPLAGLLSDLSISSDEYHGADEEGRSARASRGANRRVRNARAAAERLGIPVGTISVAQPGQEAHADEGGVMYRGRAAAELSGRAARRPWDSFGECTNEDLRDPGRVHIDPLGFVHVCQGISLGNLFRMPLREVFARYEPGAHPVAGPLLEGGPAALVRRYGLAHEDGYADPCHLCDAARRMLRARFPDILGPDQMYGVVE